MVSAHSSRHHDDQRSHAFARRFWACFFVVVQGPDSGNRKIVGRLYCSERDTPHGVCDPRKNGPMQRIAPPQNNALPKGPCLSVDAGASGVINTPFRTDARRSRVLGSINTLLLLNAVFRTHRFLYEEVTELPSIGAPETYRSIQNPVAPWWSGLCRAELYEV